MRKCCVFSTIIWLIVGGLIGAGVTYHLAQCKTSGMNIQLDSSAKAGPGITITKTGDNN